MEKDYWLERWEQEEIGFHQSDINPYLCRYWQELRLTQGSKVFVPLCGKSLDKFNRYETNGICILGGNFFDLGQKDLANVSAVYDRASLIALPPDMRENYARHLIGILPPATQVLLITLDYSQPEMSGPPFAVSGGEVEELYSEHAKICLVAQLDVLEQYPRFQERGVSQLRENIFLLTLHNYRMQR